MKNYSENVSDFLKAVGPWLDVDAGVRTTTLNLDLKVKVIKFLSPTWKDMFIKEWKTRVWFLPDSVCFPYYAQIVAFEIIPQNISHHYPSEKALEFLNWLYDHGYRTDYENDI